MTTYSFYAGFRMHEINPLPQRDTKRPLPYGLRVLSAVMFLARCWPSDLLIGWERIQNGSFPLDFLMGKYSVNLKTMIFTYS